MEIVPVLALIILVGIAATLLLALGAMVVHMVRASAFRDRQASDPAITAPAYARSTMAGEHPPAFPIAQASTWIPPGSDARFAPAPHGGWEHPARAERGHPAAASVYPVPIHELYPGLPAPATPGSTPHGEHTYAPPPPPRA